MAIYYVPLSSGFKDCVSIFSNDQPCLRVDLIIEICRTNATFARQSYDKPRQKHALSVSELQR